MSKHTPGPCERCGADNIFLGVEENNCADCDSLMRAAPRLKAVNAELLAALQVVSCMLDDLTTDEFQRGADRVTRSIVDAAIRAAQPEGD